MYDIVIIGAGLAGLTCAYQLQKKHPSLRVLIVEAKSVIGGRVVTDRTFASCPIELGAEFVHGSHNLLHQMAEEFGIPLQSIFTWAQGDGGPSPHLISGKGGYYYLSKEKKLLRFDDPDPDFIHANQIIQDLDEGPDLDQDETLYQYLEHRVSPRMISLLHAGYANTLCSDLRWLPLQETKHLLNEFEEDEGEFINRHGWDTLLYHLRRKLDIQLNWPVSRIQWKPQHVVIESESGQTIQASRVVCTPSVSVMKHLTFHPPLPIEKRDMFQRIRMESCMKIIFSFSSSFGPDDLHGLICDDGPVPEWWKKQTEHETLWMGFITSSFANTLHSFSRDELKQLLLDQLNTIFGTESDPTPSSDRFLSWMVQDWTHDPYIGGGYSSPTPGEDRTLLAKPVCDTLFFAGEATETKYMVMHAAIKSGIRVAHELVPNSKL